MYLGLTMEQGPKERIFARAAASVHAGAAGVDARHRRRDQPRAAHRPERRAALAARSAAGLRVLDPLPARHRALPHRAAGAAPAGRAAGGLPSRAAFVSTSRPDCGVTGARRSTKPTGASVMTSFNSTVRGCAGARARTVAALALPALAVAGRPSRRRRWCSAPRAAPRTSIPASTRPAPRSTRTARSTAASSTSSAAARRSCPASPRAGTSRRTAPSTPSTCARASSGTTTARSSRRATSTPTT